MEITKKQIEESNSFLPFKNKIILIKSNIEECIEKYNDKENNITYYVEDTFAKELILAKILLSSYLGVISEEEVLTLELYDQWFKNNPINQLERLKNKFKTEKDFELVEKIFDLLTDYNKFCKLFNIEVYSLLQAKNNISDRLLNNEKFVALIAEKLANSTLQTLEDKISKQITPESFKEASKELAETINKARDIVDKFDKNNITKVNS